ncbi:MAG: DUF4215 domain-containing protein, partial [Nanoarchaeota archaeon]
NGLIDENLQSCYICGNGAKEGVEECDDGNINNGDGCNSICKIEIPACVLRNAYWIDLEGNDITDAIDGQEIYLNAEGINCEDKNITFNIKEDDFSFDNVDDDVLTLNGLSPRV